MATVKKFGAFGGVFTPSILTILGVIMYLRLPWIVGQAGLYTTIGIVLVAHLISVTTGLSISSIATDKKVQAGGNYYIISRSLGLPIGGTLGIALFFGLSLSVSLYIIGFSESFLGFWGLEVSKNNIRIAGTLAIAAVTTITFISTSLAIKTQYFIMTAIGLSLISILLGKSDLAPAQPLLWPLETSAPVMVLFGIFFPAVTGFEAGVSMSGDLRDPKKSIPGGTLSAIVVGLLVYVGLPFFFSFRVEPDALVNNPNVLLDLSFFWPLVVAGIWGATISSAMGSILGAPRILQATSVDRITPRVFAKGYGSLNEPRNALLLTFAIAEVGILIGELNIIARVVSIFFITAYGFLNLSCAIENWASTDFRPAFKIPTWVSIIGSIACFLVMIELDLLVLVAGTIIMGAVFLYLTNKELTLESGDTWEGVWSSVIRSGLNRITRGTSHRRNWRPNVILFSGGSGARPHLVELGKWIVHKRGILSSFHLHEDPRAKVLFSKSQQTLRDDQDFPGLFSRKMECRDIYEGMETIARVYGFSGIDPNMVMMGWARDGGKSEGYAGLLQQLMSLDYNLLLLDYDEELGFGKQERIDIWWRGANNNASLALMLLKFLTASEAWQKSKARLLIISEDSNIINKLYRNTNRLLADQRIEAEVKVINNAIEKRPVAEIIRMESSDADLIVLGMPDVLPENVARYTADTNSLIDDLGTVLLVYASSYFEAPYIGLADVTLDGRRAHPDEEATWGAGQPEMVYPAQEELAVHLRTLHSRVESVMHEYRTGFLQAVHELNREFITELRSLSEDYFKALRNHWSDGDHPRFPRHFARVQSDMLFQSRRLFRKYKTDTLPIQAQNLEHGIEFVLSKLTALPGEFPGEVPVYYEPEYSEPQQGDSLSLRALKLRKRMARRLLGRPARMKLDIRRLADYFVAVPVRRGIYEQLQSFGTASYRLNSEIQKWFSMARDAFMAIERRLQQKELSAGMIEEEGRRLVERLQDIAGHHNAEAREIYRELLRHIRESMQQLSGELGGLEARRRILRRLRIPGASRELLSTLERAPALWNKNLSLVTHFSELELALMVGLNRLDTIMDRRSKELLLSIDNNALSVLSELRAALEAFSRELAADPAAAFRWAFDELRLFDGDSAAQDLLADLQDATEELPESIDIISEESFQDIETRQFEEVEVVTVALRRLVDYLLETELVNPIRAEAARAASQLEESLNQVQDITRLICYTSAIGGTGEDRGGHDTDGALPAMVRNALKRFGEEEERIRQVRQDLMEAFQRRLAAAFEKMNPYVLVRGAQSLGQYMRAHEGRRVLSQVEIKSRRLKNFLKNMLVGIWYRRSEGVLLAKKLRETEFTRPGQTDSLLTLVERVSPSPGVLGSLPHFYKQLFLGRQPINPEFWVRRQKEMENAEKAVARFRRGLRGAVMVVGEPQSGKTSLCRMIALRAFDRNRTYTMFAPEGGSVDPEVFYRHLSQSLQSSGGRENLFRSVAQGSAIVINDLELWWERSPGGFAVVDEIARLIMEYSDRHLFILNGNVHGFRLINRMKPIEDLFLTIIECDPLDAEDLQRAVLVRHESSGLQFELNGQPEDRISRFGYAKLFTRFFDYSAGNVGVALHAWISHIQRFGKERLAIRQPRRPDLRALELLEPERTLWLLQFIIHKRLTPVRLGRLFREQEPEVLRQLNILQRSGLVVERSPGVYEANPFLVSFVIEILLRQKVL